MMDAIIGRVPLLRLATAAALVCGCFVAGISEAVQGITGIQASYDNQTSTNDDYSTSGAGTGGFPAPNTYNIHFNVESNNNLNITAFEIGAYSYLYIQLSDRINLARVDNPAVTGLHHVILYEEVNVGNPEIQLKPSYVRTMEDSLRSANVNRGADNVFCNQGDGSGNNNNIERIDYIFIDGYPLHDSLSLRGFLVMDRGGNDAFRIAAITNLDVSGNPNGFGPPVTVLATAWGDSGIDIDTLVMRGYTEGGDVQHPSANVGVQNLTGVFITWQELGLATNQIIYGYSLVANDVTNGLDWAAPATFPLATDSGSAAGGLDLMSGGAMFFDSSVDGEAGDKVWDDWNGDGIQDANEPGISNVLIRVYDASSNLAGVTRTDGTGRYRMRGLAPGTYFLEFVAPTNYTFSPMDAGANNSIDSDANPATGRTTTFTISAGGTDTSWDAGLHLAATDLAVAKTVDDSHPNVGGTVRYLVTVTNKGPYQASSVQVTDLLPTGTVYSASAVSQGSYTATTGVWNIGSLAVGAFATNRITATIPTNAAGWTITNRASITQMNRPDSYTNDNAGSVVLSVQITDLGVLKTVNNANPYEGSNVVFAITVTNRGPDTATGVRVSDALPSGLSYVSHVAGAGLYSSVSGVWSNFSVVAGSTQTLQITASVNGGTGGRSITNTAVLQSLDQVDSASSNNQASAAVIVRGADLAVTKTVNESAPNEGATVTYTIVLRNNGPNDASGITVLERLTNGLAYAGHSASQGSYVSGTGIWTVGAVAAGNQASLSIQATVAGGTMGQTLTNISWITASSLPDPVASNNSSQATVFVSSLRVAKASSVAFAEPGSNITYTITVTNIGAATQTGVTVSDSILPGVTFVPGSISVSIMPSAAAVTNNVRDLFTVQAYTNNNGSTNWLAAWQETGESDGAAAGNARVTGGEARIRTGTSLTRSADLSGATYARFSFNYRETDALDTNNVLDQFSAISYANNNGTLNWAGNWQETGELDGAAAGDAQVLAAGVAQVRNNRALTRSVDLTGAQGATLSLTLSQPQTIITNNVRDEFSSVSYANNNGSVSWLGNWTETGDDDNAGIGDVLVENNSLRVGGRNNSAERAVNLSGYTNAVLSFLYQRVGLDNANDYVELSISTNGSTWILLTTFQGAADDVGFLSYSQDISAYITGNTQIRFLTSANSQMRSGDYVLFDNVDITFKAPVFESNDVVSVQVSSNGTTWVGLANFAGTLSGTITTNFNILGYASSNTAIRIATTNYQDTAEVVRVDNVDVTWRRPNLEADDMVYVRVSSNGTDWATLLTLTDDLGAAPLGTNFNILAYASTNTRVRFETSGYTGANEEFFFDNADITFVKGGVAGTPGTTPPTLASGYTLNTGAVMTVTFQAAVNNPLLQTAVTNTVAVTSTQHPTPKQATVVNSTVYLDLALTKAIDSANPGEGSNVVFTIVVTNAGPAGATGVEALDLLPSGVHYVTHSTSQGSYNSGSGVWTVGSIPMGASATLTLTASVDAGTAGRTITNTAAITQLLQADSNAANNQGSAAFVVKGADLGVTKTVDNPLLYVKENVIYTIGVTNSGPNNASGVSIQDRLTNCLSYVSSVPSQGSYDSGSGLWTIGGLPVGGYATLQITANVQTNSIGWTVTNTAAVAALDQIDRNPTNDRASVTIQPLYPPLDIVKRSNKTGPVDPGGTIIYTIAVTNTGAAAQTGVSLTDLLPSGVNYVAGSARVTGPMATNVTFRDEFGSRTYANNDGTVSWSGDWAESQEGDPTAGNLVVELDNVRVQTFTFKFAAGNGWIRRGANLAGYTNAVLSFDYRRVSLEAGEYVAAQVSSNGVAGPWVELGRLEGPADDAAYGATNFSIRPYLTTNTMIQFISPIATMDAGDIVWLDDVQIRATRWATNTVVGMAPPTVATNFTLASGESLVATLNVTVPSPPTRLSLTNSASVNSALMTQPKYAEVVDTVAQADLEVTKTACTNNVATNEVVWFTIAVTNLGPHGATEIELTDYWPSEILFSNYWATVGTYESGSGVWSGFTLAVGQGATLVITGTVNVASEDLEITNVAAVTHVRQYDRFPANDRAETVMATLVVLSRLEAFRIDGQVVVEWETASELNTAGFWLERLTPGGYVRVYGPLIAAVPGAPQGGIYRCPDPGAPAADEMTYRLIELETMGRQLAYGPFTVAIQPGTGEVAVSATARISASTEARVVAASVAATRPAALSSAGYSVLGGSLSTLKLAVRETGVYGVTANELALAMGVDAISVQTEFEAGNVRLLNRGVDVPCRVSGDNTALYFHGEKPDSIYTDDNIYWLHWETGAPMATLDTGVPAGAGEATSFADSQHGEEQRYALTGLRTNPGGDFWLWDYFVAGGDAAGPKAWVLRTPGAVDEPGNASLTVRLQGASSAVRGSDHCAVVFAEGRRVGEVRWSGLTETNATFPVPQEWLADGDVTVSILAQLDPLVPYSIFYLDSMDVTYTRRHEALDGQLELAAGTNNPVAVAGFAGSDVEVWDLSGTSGPRVVTHVDVSTYEGGYLAAFVPSAADARAVAFEPALAWSPESIIADTASALAVPENSARYIVITTAGLKPAAQRLAAWRSGRGLASTVVLLEDIYDEFNFGMPDPEAIRNFLKYAAGNWVGHPRYVVLAGEGTYDFKDFLEADECRIPPYLIAAATGVLPADDRYGDVDDDGVPELAVGRLPAASMEELDVLVDKIIAYESGAAAEWQTRLTLVADVPDAGGDFTASSEAVGAQAPGGWTTAAIHRSALDAGTARANLLAAIAQGTAFVNFFGHGGIDIMGDDGLLESADVAGMENSNHLAIVTAMTCVLGRFETPGYDCLGEELLLKADGGAIAVFAPVGWSFNSSAEALSKEFYRQLFNGGKGILGDAVLVAKQQYAAEGRNLAVPELYNLLGDPALTVGGFDAVYPAVDDDGRNLSFAEWQRTVFSWDDYQTPAVAGEQADPDGDGLVNILEYAFGKGARAVDGEALLRVDDVQGGVDHDMSVVFRRNRSAGDLVFHVDVSADLVTWYSDVVHVPETQVTDDGNGTTETVRVLIRTPDPEKRLVYVRLRTWKK